MEETGKKAGTRITVPVAEPSELIVPITMSPRAAPVRANVPVVVWAVLCEGAVADVNAAVPKLTAVSLGPDAPNWVVPTVE